jgi:hypothetical protein
MERRAQVRRKDVIPVGRVELEERPDLGPAGVVHEAVDSPEAVDDGADERRSLTAVADVRLERLGVRAEPPRALHGPCCAIR